LALELESFDAIVRGNARLDRYMPPLDYLSDEQIVQLHAYVRAGAREALERQHNPEDRASTPQGEEEE
jgi:quinohemoprotein ethanol dehydrogenase